MASAEPAKLDPDPPKSGSPADLLHLLPRWSLVPLFIAAVGFGMWSYGRYGSLEAAIRQEETEEQKRWRAKVDSAPSDFQRHLDGRMTAAETDIQAMKEAQKFTNGALLQLMQRMDESNKVQSSLTKELAILNTELRLRRQ